MVNLPMIVRRSRASLVLLIFGLLSGCAARHPATVADFRELLVTRGPTTDSSLVATFFEVGLGDAILLEFPSGKSLLIDSGIGLYSQFILNYLEARGIEELDGLLLTHPHQDHYGGMKDLVESIPIGRFFHNGAVSSAGAYSRLQEAIASKGIPDTVLRRGDALPDFGDASTRIDVLYPDPDAFEVRGNANCGSIVLRVTHEDVVFLFTGDTENKEEARLLKLGSEALRADVLKLGHHGSPCSGSEEFLTAISPDVAIVQGTRWANVHPVFPRPSYHLRSILPKMGVRLLNPKKDGTVQVISDGTSVRCRTMQDTVALRTTE
ncbi:MAG: MBL fold metallo-hydrolase [Planctomycetota bacterium]